MIYIKKCLQTEMPHPSYLGRQSVIHLVQTYIYIHIYEVLCFCLFVFSQNKK